MVRYVIDNLSASTPQAEQDRLVGAVKKIPGVKDVVLNLGKKELTFGIAGPEPKLKLLKEACSSAGFNVGARM